LSDDGNLSGNRVINGVPALLQLEANDDAIRKLLQGTRFLKKEEKYQTFKAIYEHRKELSDLLRFCSRQRISSTLSLGVINC
jgi:hypothetical protein